MFRNKAQELTRKGDQFLRKFTPGEFHKEAAELLSKVEIHKDFNYQELVLSTFNQKLPEQNFKNFEFSDLPLTIARGENCFIDLYFWRRRPTVVHNHHFRGAFQCLEGFNVDSEYKFKTLKKLTKLHSVGDLKLKRIKTLKKGDIEAIHFQDKFIHQNHHQSDLTVNLCFRTHDVPGKNLSNFLYSGLKYEKNQLALNRASRLYSFTRIDHFDHRKLNLTLEDAFNFLIMSYDSNAAHPSFLKLKKFFEAKVKKETGLNLEKLFIEHDKELERIEAQYE